MIDAIAVPGFFQAVAELAPSALSPGLKRGERGQCCVEVSGPEQGQSLFTHRSAPFLESLAIAEPFSLSADCRIHEQSLQFQSSLCVSCFPGELCLPAPAECLLQGSFCTQPTQRSQLLSVAETGFQVASGSSILKTFGQLLFPPVSSSAESGNTPQCGDQPEAG